VIGGAVDHALGWRAAFWVAGIPGILLSLLVLTVADPLRGQNDAEAVPRPRLGLFATYLDLLRNRTYILSVLGYAAYTFALGGLAFWMPAWLERARGMTRPEATVTFGVIALVTGFVGTFSGGWLGDRLLKRTPQAYLWVSGIATLAAAPVTLLGLTSTDRWVYLPAIVVGEILIFVSTGPINSAILNAVSPVERATAVGLSVFLMHFLGDIPSPPLIGMISDASSLARALVIVPGAILISGAIWTFAAWEAGRRGG
ncbi:MAG: MFS transporter, partial [Thermoanaerobaculia bacterium]